MSDNGIYVDVEEGLKRVLNNKQLYIKLLKKFKDTTNLNELADAIHTNDLTSAKEKVHTMKGLSANLSLTKLFLKTQELENKIKEGIADKASMKSLQDTFDETLIYIDKVIEEDGNST